VSGLSPVAAREAGVDRVDQRQREFEQRIDRARVKRVGDIPGLV
jgi:hypothetical protein